MVQYDDSDYDNDLMVVCLLEYDKIDKKDIYKFPKFSLKAGFGWLDISIY